jgi:hypothetical protein
MTKGQIMMFKIIQRTSLLNSSRKNTVLQFEISLKKYTIIFVMYNSPYRLMICRVLYQTKFYDKQKTIWKLKPQIIGPEKDWVQRTLLKSGCTQMLRLVNSSCSLVAPVLLYVLNISVIRHETGKEDRIVTSGSCP